MEDWGHSIALAHRDGRLPLAEKSPRLDLSQRCSFRFERRTRPPSGTGPCSLRTEAGGLLSPLLWGDERWARRSTLVASLVGRGKRTVRGLRRRGQAKSVLRAGDRLYKSGNPFAWRISLARRIRVQPKTRRRRLRIHPPA